MAPAFNPDRPTFTPTSLTGRREPRPTRTGKLMVPGSYNLECNPASMVPSCKAFFGGEDIIGGLAVASPVYPHRFHMAALASWFAEERFSGITQFLLAKGLYHGSTTWKFAEQGFMEATFNHRSGEIGMSGATSVTGTIIDTTGYDPFDYILMVVKMNGSVIAYGQNEELTFDNKLVEALAQDSTRFLAAVGTEIPVFSGKGTFLFQDAALFNLAIASAEVSFEWWIPHERGYGLLVEAPLIRLKPGAVAPQGTGFVLENISFDGYGRAGTGLPARVWSGYWKTSTLPSMTGLTLIVNADGLGDETVTFASPTTLDAIVTAYNAAATHSVMSVDADPEDHTATGGGVLRIQSKTNGTTSTLVVNASSTADAVLGFSNTAQAGLDGVSLVATVLSPLAA